MTEFTDVIIEGRGTVVICNATGKDVGMETFGVHILPEDKVFAAKKFYLQDRIEAVGKRP